MHRYATLAALCLLIGPLGETWAAATLTRYPYVQNVGRDRVTIMWRTATPVAQTLAAGTGSNPAVAWQTEAAPTTDHEVTLTGLESGTTYNYRVFENGLSVLSDPEMYWFKTDPGRDEGTFSFFVTGDVGAELPDGLQSVTGRMIRNIVPMADFGILTGDIIYPDGESSAYDPQLMSLWKDFMCHTPLYPCLGNHDWHVDPDQNFAREWALPNNEHYYSFDYGNTHFIALDTADGFLYDEVNQVAWLEQDLAAVQHRTTWIVVYFHHPVLTCTYKGDIPEISSVLYPLFDQYNVDLVLNGHAHTYERLFPVHGGVPVDQAQNPRYVDPQGFITVVTGCGAKLKLGEPTTFCGPTAYFVDERLSFTQVFVYGLTMVIVHFDSQTGHVLDYATLTKTVDPTDVVMTPVFRGLSQNQPNPFNPTTIIPYEVPTAQHVALTIYSIDGRRVVNLVDGVVAAGRHRALWDGRDLAGARVASGAYLCRMDTEDHSWTIKMTLVR